MLKTEDLVLPSAPPLIGLVALKEGEDFDESKLMEGNYRIETIDGCHSLNAQRKCLTIGTDNVAFETRDVVLYRNLVIRSAFRLASPRTTRQPPL